MAAAATATAVAAAETWTSSPLPNRTKSPGRRIRALLILVARLTAGRCRPFGDVSAGSAGPDRNPTLSQCVRAQSASDRRRFLPELGQCRTWTTLGRARSGLLTSRGRRSRLPLRVGLLSGRAVWWLAHTCQVYRACWEHRSMRGWLEQRLARPRSCVGSGGSVVGESREGRIPTRNCAR